MRQMIRSLLTLQKRQRSTKLLSSVLQSLQMPAELRNSSLSRCGDLLTELLEIFSMEPYSESQLSSLTFQDLSQDGHSPSLLVDMHLEINIDAKTMLSQNREKLKLNSHQMMALNQLFSRLTTLRKVVAIWECLMSTLQFVLLQDHASGMLSQDRCL